MMINANIAQGDITIHMASQTILEIYNINGLNVKSWIKNDKVDFLNKSVVPKKTTLLHDYIESIYIRGLNNELETTPNIDVINEMKEIFDLKKIDYSCLGPFKYFGYNEDSLPYEEDSNVVEYADKMESLFIDTALPIVANDIFTILFSDKHILFEFNRQLSELIVNLEIKDYPDFLFSDGVLKRCSYLPTWLKKGVFFRDKGRCQLCGTDLTKLLAPDTTENYDHIIPLEMGGTNDPTNFQLTCEHCNKSKGATNSLFNNTLVPFWEIENMD